MPLCCIATSGIALRLSKTKTRRSFSGSNFPPPVLIFLHPIFCHL
jgi:hypothetical protein